MQSQLRHSVGLAESCCHLGHSIRDHGNGKVEAPFSVVSKNRFPVRPTTTLVYTMCLLHMAWGFNNPEVGSLKMSV